MSGLSLRHRLGLGALACLQNGLFGGIIFGWATIDRTLLAAPLAQGGAALSGNETTTIYSWACSVSLWGNLLVGMVLDAYGPRACSVLGHVSIGVGCICFAAASSLPSFVIATSLIGFGGPAFQLSILHLAKLFPDHEFLALNVMNGTISLSFLVLTSFGWMWKAIPGVTYRILFGSLSAVVIVSMMASIRFWPDEPFEVEWPDDREGDGLDDLELPDEDVSSLPVDGPVTQLGTGAAGSLTSLDPPQTLEAQWVDHRHVSFLIEQPLGSYLREELDSEVDTSLAHRHHSNLNRHLSFRASQYSLATRNYEFVSLKDRPFLQQFLSGTHVRTLLVFASCCFLTNFFIASISTELADLQDFSSEQQESMIQVMTLIMAAGLVLAVLAGWLIDRLGLDLATLATLCLGQAHVVLIMIYHDQWSAMVASFVSYIAFRQFCYGVYFSTLTAKLGFKYFGLLIGIGFVFAGTLQVWMSSLVSLVQGDCHLQQDNVAIAADRSSSRLLDATSCDHGHWMTLHQVELVVLTSLMLAPIVEHYISQQRDQRAQQWLRTMLNRDLKQAAHDRMPSSPCPTAGSTSNSSYGSFSHNQQVR